MVMHLIYWKHMEKGMTTKSLGIWRFGELFLLVIAEAELPQQWWLDLLANYDASNEQRIAMSR